MMVLLAVALALQSAAEPELAVSVEKVRAGLARPATFQITLPEPKVHFRILIQEHPSWTDEPPGWSFKAPPMTPLSAPAFGPPGSIAGGSGKAGGVEMLSLIGASILVIANAAHARHAIQERNAQKEVHQGDRRVLRNPRLPLSQCLGPLQGRVLSLSSEVRWRI
jgi:hypothetical protein